MCYKKNPDRKENENEYAPIYFTESITLFNLDINTNNFMVTFMVQRFQCGGVSFYITCLNTANVL